MKRKHIVNKANNGQSKRSKLNRMDPHDKAEPDSSQPREVASECQTKDNANLKNNPTLGDSEAMVFAKPVNVKVSNIRPAYHDLRDWCNDSDRNLYVGRGGIVFVKGDDGVRQRFPKQDSVLHNPFKIGAIGVPDRDSACDQYRAYLENKLDEERSLGNEEGGKFHMAMREAMGKLLGCWCKPLRCHADEIVAVLKARFCDEPKCSSVFSLL
ncbi:hypothetical protein BJ742DRAFT_782627 [Cladochytrium replicatum]|nr:hypothetical protein BJ742DRAFT_782627 [Cladochytrium replicatum]